MMPVAMIAGGLFYNFFEKFSFCTPLLIAIMMFISYTNISLADIRINRLHISLLSIQVIGSLIILLILLPFDKTVAEGSMICLLAPTATSAVVITGMLGGNMASLTTYSLLSNMSIVLIAPLVFSLIGDGESISFVYSVFSIFSRVFALLLLPFLVAVLLKFVSPAAHSKIRKAQSVSFVLWTFALAIVTGKTIRFILDQGKSYYHTEIILAVTALLICLAQFYIGRRLGAKYNDTIAGGQGLGQKNTILAIWMAQTHLTPISSIAPGAYILWQNIVNSYQVWRKQRQDDNQTQ